MESSTSSEVVLEDFGQKVDLTRRIREVLLDYPEGTTVLKELIQNAGDAGAGQVCLCLAYNDAVFQDDLFFDKRESNSLVGLTETIA